MLVLTLAASYGRILGYHKPPAGGGRLTLKRIERGFTLVEIMIVVLIIGILLAICVPNFIKAREASRKASCVVNLRQIENAMNVWLKKEGDFPRNSRFLGTEELGTMPLCPGGGTYTVNLDAGHPTCSISGHQL